MKPFQSIMRLTRADRGVWKDPEGTWPWQVETLAWEPAPARGTWRDQSKVSKHEVKSQDHNVRVVMKLREFWALEGKRRREEWRRHRLRRG